MARHARFARRRAGAVLVWALAFALKLLDDARWGCGSEARTRSPVQLTAVFHVLAGLAGLGSTSVQNEVLQRECGCFDDDDGGGEKEGIDEEEGDGRAEEEGIRN